ncbi:response regulator [Leucothrix sargassi]|nr:response regulator [Leucothrix sargassi]
MNILIVDDALDVRFLVSSIVRKLGHTVTEAVDGVDALNKLKSGSFTTVISDCNMPNMGGFELCEKIREENFPTYIYIILLTGLSGKDSILKGINSGADDFASKPVTLEEMRIRLLGAQRVIDLEEMISRKNEALQIAHDHIQKDLESAALTQLRSLPAPLKTDSVAIEWFYKPAVFIGGDTFNYFQTQTNCLVFFSLDVSGHGISAAMLSMSMQVFLGLKRGFYGGQITQDRLDEIPALFAKNLNECLLDQYKHDHYLTMMFGIVNMDTNKVHYVQAGHPQPYWYKASDNSMQAVDVNGFPVGLIPDAEYETEVLQMEPGDKFIVYSDGISENDSLINQQPLDGENLKQHFENIKTLSAADMMKTIEAEWLSKEQLNELPDDVSFLALEFTTPPPKNARQDP